jgi:hypothetical protein
LNRSEVISISVSRYFNKRRFQIEFFKNGANPVRFSPGFLSGGGFSAEHFACGGFFYILVNSTELVPTSMKMFCQISKKNLSFQNLKILRQIFSAPKNFGASYCPPGLRHPRTGVVFKKFCVKTTFK